MTRPSTRSAQPARWLLAALVVLIAVALAWVLLGATESALNVWSRLRELPAWSRWLFLVVIVALAAGSGWLVWRLLHPGQPRVPRAEPIARAQVEARLRALPPADPAAQRAEQELADSDRRRDSAQLYVALFGDISAGKSALMTALAPHSAARSDVLGGTTRAVTQAAVTLADGLRVQLADVPGLGEIGGQAWAALAHAEASRAHALIYVVDAELTRTQDAELRRVGAFGKPLLLALNKADRYSAAELATLIERLRTRYADLVTAVIPVQAGGREQLRHAHADGSNEVIDRARTPQLQALTAALAGIADLGPAALEPARAQAVLAAIDASLTAREQALRGEHSAACVRKYTRRAVIGALAAVAPGTDLIIQGALATALLRELAALHDLRVRDLDLDRLVEHAGGLVRTSTSITLAIAGNALKAFPGLGTISGGLLHAVAYGLIFDSLGRAVATTLEQTKSLDRTATLNAFEAELQRPGRERLELLVGIARDALRERERPDDERPQ